MAKTIQLELIHDFISGGLRPNPKYKPKAKCAKAKTPTNALTKAIDNYVTFRGGYCMRINVAGFYRQDVGYIKSGSTLGVPDLITVHNGRLIGVEVKTGSDTQSNEQKAVQAKIQAANGVYIIARTFDQFKVEFDNVISSI